MITFLLEEKTQQFPQSILGTVEQAIAYNQPGRVKCLGTSWPAQFYEPENQTIVTANQSVWVIGRKSITLLIIPVHEWTA